MLILLLLLVTGASTVRLYEQCGGEGWRGSTVCDSPTQCFRRSKWFSSCQVACPGSDWECATNAGNSVGSAQPWDQCGGEGWRGPTSCIQYACRARSVYYSQCRPDCPQGWLCSGSATPIAATISTAPTSSSLVTSPTRPSTTSRASSSVPLASFSSSISTTLSQGTSPSSVHSTASASTEAISTPGGEVNGTDEIGGDIDDINIEDIEGLDELAPYDPSEFENKEFDTDDFFDPSEQDLDELQQQENGDDEEFQEYKDIFGRRRKRRQNTASGSSCEADGVSGVCLLTSSCTGKSVPGHCSGSVNIQCCIEEEETYGSCQVNNAEGICRDISSCKDGTSYAGKCPGDANVQCCIKKTSTAATSTAGSSNNQLCGSYVNEATSVLEGNSKKQFQVVKIKREHLSNPSHYTLNVNSSDNTMAQKTACAFDKMASMAKKSNVVLKINSGFRVFARQQYFYNCYKTGKCNNGAKAAVPGTSNHGIGLALDISTNCGSQKGATAPAACTTHSNGVYQWLYTNAHKFGFTRTVKSEPWHWEFRGIGVERASFS
ncbi:unnamed protein product [Adineta steineri]|uniref:CBM1 domain-containing protein n=1 Tax=Adineta steineri TaxID=433720 RepID=A0A819TM06_9BILA|nr:unnamed protein product [Adineta steineri]CAF4082007.1 unnamed protein product [Adineta steineri]